MIRHRNDVGRRLPHRAIPGLAVLPLILATELLGQTAAPRPEPDSFVNQQRAIQRRMADEFDAQMAEVQRVTFDWGGWYSLHVFLFDDGVESSRTFRRHDLRLWTRASIDDGTHQFYFRARTSFLDFNAGDSYDGNDDDVEGPKIERGVYRFDLARALNTYQGRDAEYSLVANVGRDLVVFGTGLALSTPLDHVSMTASFRDFELTALAGRTIGSSPDIDLTRPIDRTRRMFYGAELNYRGLERHRPFTYVLWQRDRNSDRPVPIGQQFDYDSFYYGLGSSGEVVDRLRYGVELVYESGRGSNYGILAGRNRIQAFGTRAELEYLFPGEHRPRASIEYTFGSGDSDRRLSPTDTLGGNRGDNADNAFIGFGYVDTGLAFAPRSTNLHMCRAGASFYPWPNHERLSRFEVGTDWYIFHKHHRDGAVSDPTADLRSGYLGWEMDYFANWRITSDLAWTTRFGAFFPGDAFSNRTTRTFLLVGMVWSF